MISYRSQELGGQITAPVAPESSPSPGSTSPPALGHWHRDALHARRYHGPRHASDECTWRGGRAEKMARPGVNWSRGIIILVCKYIYIIFFYSVFYDIVSYDIILCFMLYYIILFYSIVYHIILFFYIILYGFVLYYIILYCLLCYIMSLYFILYCFYVILYNGILYYSI